MYTYCLPQTSPPRLSPDTLNLCPNKTHDLHPTLPPNKNQNKTKLKAKPPGPFSCAPLLETGPTVHPLCNPDMYVPLSSVPILQPDLAILYLFYAHLLFYISNATTQATILSTYTSSVVSSLASPCTLDPLILSPHFRMTDSKCKSDGLFPSLPLLKSFSWFLWIFE